MQTRKGARIRSGAGSRAGRTAAPPVGDGGHGRLEFPAVEVAVGMFRQASLVPLLLRGVPADRVGVVAADVEDRMRRVGQFAPLVSPIVEVVAVKPG